VVRVEQSVEDAAGAVRTRRGQVLVPALYADRCGQRRELQVDRSELHFHPAFVLLVGEGLPDAVSRYVGGIGEPEFVVLVVAVAKPESDGVDRGRLKTEFTFAGDFGLLHVDTRVVGGAVEAGDVIEAVELRDRCPDKAVVENVGAADRLAVGAHRRIRLPAAERLRLIGGRQIRIVRNAILVGVAAVDVGMHRDVVLAGVDQRGAVDAVVHRTDGPVDFAAVAARRNDGRNPIVVRIDHAADRLRAVA